MKSSLILTISLGLSLTSAIFAGPLSPTPTPAEGQPSGSASKDQTSLKLVTPSQISSNSVMFGQKFSPPSTSEYCAKDVVATPEPASLALLGSGLIGITLYSRKRKRA